MESFADPHHPDVKFSYAHLAMPQYAYDQLQFQSHLNDRARLGHLLPFMNAIVPYEYSLARQAILDISDPTMALPNPTCIATSLVLGPPPKEGQDDPQLSSDEEQSGNTSKTTSLSSTAPLTVCDGSKVNKIKADDMDVQDVQKRRRTSVACDACRHRKARCSGGVRCNLCLRDGSRCVYDRHPRTRYVPIKTSSKTTSGNQKRRKRDRTASNPMSSVEPATTDTSQNWLPTPEMSRISTVSPLTDVGSIMLQPEPPTMHVRVVTEDHGLAFLYWQESNRQNAISQLQYSVANGREADQTMGTIPGIYTPASNGASLSEEEAAVVEYLIDDGAEDGGW
ncbi:hypothetical protein I302_108688 [Kwoniella bestiolae CBS 10118]|uniref:Zn(2)-C6 fungal-type domain-containing protein n=1 Tax=Kwoniella bestiolae CBS 10118 TaxID=1296100 RepID=A0A1B9FTT9_9TREE|nr:hypothetical protein I302_07824 [Kwoniella bestiolae CBS 10118]OCF22180.1 hypothetical protein I302_07824 [Kwoniella bestiolae CBS 10118]